MIRSSRGAVATSLRERTRQAVRADIAANALALFTDLGFDAVTVGQIATASGISERSFFRYFATKEDVVIGDPAPYGVVLQSALEECPLTVEAWDALHLALSALVAHVAENRTASLQASALMMSTPALRARHLEKQLLWESMLVPAVTRRLRGPTASRSMRARAVVSAGLSCLDAAVNAWAEGGGRGDLRAMLDIAMAAVRPA